MAADGHEKKEPDQQAGLIRLFVFFLMSTTGRKTQVTSATPFWSTSRMVVNELPAVQPMLIEPHKSQKKIRRLIAADLDYPEDLVNTRPLMLLPIWDILGRLTDCNLGITGNDISGDADPWLGLVTIPLFSSGTDGFGLAVRSGHHPRIYSTGESQALCEYADRLIDSLCESGRML